MRWYKFGPLKKNDSKSRRREPIKSQELQYLEMDFFCHLNYLAAIATSGINRNGLFDQAAKLPLRSTAFFKRINFVAKMYNHDYSESCRIVGEQTKEPSIKAFLLRLSGTLASGEDLSGYLAREAEIFSESYGNGYERRLEGLKKWSDAYVALFMASALVTVMSVVSMMIGNITISFIIALTVATISITIFGAWFIYTMSPKEHKVHSLEHRSKEQGMARNLARIVLPLGLMVTLALIVMQMPLGAIITVAGAFMLPAGYFAVVDNKKIDQRDGEIASFVRSVGGVSQAINATTSQALGRIEFSSFGSLKPLIETFFTRIGAGIRADLCWERFVSESGSELINRTILIFGDGINIGGQPQQVGIESSEFATRINYLRAQRKIISSGFEWLVLVMHVVLIGLVVFIYEILFAFSTVLQEMMESDSMGDSMSAGLTTFTSGWNMVYLDLLNMLIIVIVMMLTIANAFSIHSISGGHILKLFYYLGITTMSSGLALLLVPSVVTMMFAGG